MKINLSLQAALSLGFTVVFCVAQHKLESRQTALVAMSNSTDLPSLIVKEECLTPQLPQLKWRKLYEAASSEYERRKACMQLINERGIARGTLISSVDSIFNTHFAENLPGKKERIRPAKVFFSPQPTPGDLSEGFINVGWYLAIEYDWTGRVQGYYLSNLHK